MFTYMRSASLISFLSKSDRDTSRTRVYFRWLNSLADPIPRLHIHRDPIHHHLAACLQLFLPLRLSRVKLPLMSVRLLFAERDIARVCAAHIYSLQSGRDCNFAYNVLISSRVSSVCIYINAKRIFFYTRGIISFFFSFTALHNFLFQFSFFASYKYTGSYIFLFTATATNFLCKTTGCARRLYMPLYDPLSPQAISHLLQAHVKEFSCSILYITFASCINIARIYIIKLCAYQVDEFSALSLLSFFLRSVFIYICRSSGRRFISRASTSSLKLS